MATKAKLRVILKANDTVVAEIEDANLWQRVLAAINQGEGVAPLAVDLKQHDSTSSSSEFSGPAPAIGSVANFARGVGVTVDQLVGALDPKTDAPYLHLDSHAWEAMKKALPQRGPGALPPIGLAGTLLALWLKEIGGVAATQGLAIGVLATIHLGDKNPGRGIKNTKWLQARAGGVIVINPAEITKAKEIAKAFCTHKWSGEVS